MKRTKNVRAVILAAMFAACVSAWGGTGGAAPADFAWTRTLTPADGDGEGVFGLVLDEDVYLVTDLDLGNLRVFDAAGREVPFLVRPRRQARMRRVEDPVALEKIALRVLSDNRLEVVLRRTPVREPRRVDVLRFVSPVRDFEKQVTVYVGDDGERWTQRAEKRPIFDYSRFIDVRNDRVECDGGTSAYYRVVIENIREVRESPFRMITRDRCEGEWVGEQEQVNLQREDFRIESILAFSCREEAVWDAIDTAAYAVDSFRVEHDRENKRTLVLFGTSRTPVRRLRIETATRNFSRRVDVDAAGPDPVAESSDSPPARSSEWRRLASATVARVDLPGFREAGTEIDLGSPRRYRWYRLTVHDLDSPPLEKPSVQVFGPEEELVMLARPGESYRLSYGGLGVKPPRYDLVTVLARAETARVGELATGIPVANRELDAQGAWRWRGAATARAALLGTLAAMVVVLGWVLRVALRKMDDPGAGRREMDGPDA